MSPRHSRKVYTEVDDHAARAALDTFTKSELGKANPHTVGVFTDAWTRFIPFLAFPPMLYRVIYTTTSTKSLNYQLHKVTKNRGHFPNDDAVVKLLWLATYKIKDKRARNRAKERTTQGHLVKGQTATG